MLPLQVWKDEHAPASALLACYLKKYGLGEALQWEPELMRKEIEEDYDIRLSDLQSDKLQAAITVFTTQAFETQWEAFETICHLMNNIPDDMETFDPLEAEEIAVAVGEVALIKHEKILYGSEVDAYAGQVFYDYGFSKPPKLFPSAIMPKCVDCDDTEKNEALQELFDANLKRVTEYLNSLAL